MVGCCLSGPSRPSTWKTCTKTKTRSETLRKCEMAKLGKSMMAQTFKFDCDRYLRFKLASEEEKARHGFEEDRNKRPGIQLMTAAGQRWEADKYEDLIAVTEEGAIHYDRNTEVDSLVERRLFRKVENLFELLGTEEPPLGIIEGEFTVPLDVTPGYREAVQRAGLEPVGARPDILWLRPYGTGAPLVEGHGP